MNFKVILRAILHKEGTEKMRERMPQGNKWIGNKKVNYMVLQS